MKKLLSILLLFVTICSFSQNQVTTNFHLGETQMACVIYFKNGMYRTFNHGYDSAFEFNKNNSLTRLPDFMGYNQYRETDIAKYGGYMPPVIISYPYPTTDFNSSAETNAPTGDYNMSISFVINVDSTISDIKIEKDPGYNFKDILSSFFKALQAGTFREEYSLHKKPIGCVRVIDGNNVFYNLIKCKIYMSVVFTVAKEN